MSGVMGTGSVSAVSDVPVDVNPGRAARTGGRRLPTSVLVGAAIVGLMALAAVLAPWIAPHDPNALDFSAQLRPPSWSNWMGTDENGRDVFSRVLFGFRLDLAVVALITYLPLPVGLLLGAVAGYFGGWTETIIARIGDVMLSFPFMVLVIAIVGLVGPGLKGVMVGVLVVSWAFYARLARADMLVIKELPYMEACTVLGYSAPRAIFRHAIPNLVRNCFVFSTIDVMGNLLLLASVSYIGLGVQPPTAELGTIIAGGQPFLLNGWWVATLPGLFLVLFGVGLGLIGEGLSDQQHRRSGG
ncbi:MAG: ABC transporter permease [Ilumatobacteraceae bacterium]